MTNINDASGAYLNALKQIKGGDVGGVDNSAKAGSSEFADMVKNSLEGAIESQKKSEQVSAAAIAGDADMTDVLQAINDAEMALNTVLAIRDKVIQAYEEVIRTPI